jgi:hypothetical protein
MNPTIGDIPKRKRGRKPTTGRGHGVLVRLHQPTVGALDDAAKAGGVSRAEVVRRALVEWLTACGFLHRQNPSDDEVER